MKTKLPASSPDKICASIRKELCGGHFVITNLVPLHNPVFGEIFRNKITGQPTFNSNLKGGRPGGSSEFKKSFGYRYAPMSLFPFSPNILSAAKYVTFSPGNISNTIELIAFTSSLRAERMIRSVKKVGVVVPATVNCG
ncbi:hypothetical protein Dimus_038145 [Dionaea muscipula]